VRVTVPQLPPAAQLGMTASVAVGSATGAQVILPLAAIVKTPRDASANVWVVNPQTRKVNLKPVTVASFGETGAVITGGLSGGEVVVVAGAHKLLPDQVVALGDVAKNGSNSAAPATSPAAKSTDKPKAGA
jgi:multidrug efflux pump subunit AcrA (membrane-fusion protein)